MPTMAMLLLVAADPAVALAEARATIVEMQVIAKTPEERRLVLADQCALAKFAEQNKLSYSPVPASGQDQLLNATKQMQDTQMSFNLQCLQLQSQAQHENRSATAISNVMKTKHDTVKNSISNVR